MAMLEETARILGEVKGMQRGYTTGTTAQGACKAAVELLLSGTVQERVEVTLPEGLILPLALKEVSFTSGRAVCAVEKDPGDDKDITKGMLIYGEAVLVDEVGVFLVGGLGIGRVTRAGLAVKPGEAAINPVPRRMILKDLDKLYSSSSLETEGKGIQVTLSIPRGEELARKTWNPRLGIVKGLSVIGTTGIVEPKSQAAYMASIDVCVDMCFAFDPDFLCITLGYVGEKALALESPKIPSESVVKCGDHVGHTIAYAVEKGFKEIYLVGHVGKLVKLAVGIFNTHWESGDGRMETLAAYAGILGASTDMIQKIMDMDLAEEAAGFLVEKGYGKVFSMVSEKIIRQMEKRYEGPFYRVAVVNLDGLVLGLSKGKPPIDAKNRAHDKTASGIRNS